MYICMYVTIKNIYDLLSEEFWSREIWKLEILKYVLV